MCNMHIICNFVELLVVFYNKKESVSFRLLSQNSSPSFLLNLFMYPFLLFRCYTEKLLDFFVNIFFFFLYLIFGFLLHIEYSQSAKSENVLGGAKMFFVLHFISTTQTLTMYCILHTTT